MNLRNALLTVVIVVLAATGIFFWKQRLTLAEAAPAPPPALATVTPMLKPAAPLALPKSAVVAPTAPPAAALAPSPVAAAKPGVDPQLNAAVTELINELEAGDIASFVQNYMVPSMTNTLRTSSIQPNGQDITPEIRAQMDQVMQQRMPQMIQRMTDRMTQQFAQNPQAAESFQKLAAALKLAQANPPQINDAGDRATYALPSNGDKEIPPNISMILIDGKWTLDFASMTGADQGP